MLVKENKIYTADKYDVEGGKFKVPDFITEIEEGCFKDNDALEHVILPQTLTSIKNEAFDGCVNLQEIVIPENVDYIGKNAFGDCRKLKSVKLPNGLKAIVKDTFTNCASLEEINIPSGLKIVGVTSFWGCFSLKEVNLPEGVENIESSAFGNCRQLKKINLPSTLKNIGSTAFTMSALEEIDFPENLLNIGEFAFRGCTQLKEVTIPKKIKALKTTFDDCISLEKINLPEGLEIIESAFIGCISLKKLDIPASVKFAKDLCFRCESMEEVSINKDCKVTGSNRTLKYVTKKGDRFLFTKERMDETSFYIGEYNHFHMGIIMQYWDIKEKLVNSNIDNNTILILNKYYEILSPEQFKNVLEKGNLKFIRQIIKDTRITTKDEFFKLFYNLGGLMRPQIFRRTSKSGNVIEEKVDYAQKVCEFMKEIERLESTQSIPLLFGRIQDSLKDMSCDGFKKDFTDFFLNKENYRLLVEEDNLNSGFISKCYNLFEEIQSTNTSNKGKQNQLKPTIEKLKEYFKEVGFAGVTSENKQIAETIKPYFSRQNDFDNAVSIAEERKSKGTGTRILSEHLAEQDVFSSIHEYTQKIQESAVDSLHMLTDLANKEFTYEFLEKDDPDNFILGKLCSCCAHLAGSGYGIMRASIVHPDIQNLVIRDKKNDIIGKATLYINREEGFGVCNTFAVNQYVDRKYFPALLKKFKEALGEFASRYNAEYPEKPIKQINVGLGMNDLEYQLTCDGQRHVSILKPIDFGEYGKDGYVYDGDSKNEQVVVWQKEEGNERGI